MPQVIVIPTGADNYTYLLTSRDHAVIIDPGEALPVLRALRAHRLTADAILLTHHHADHCAGVTALTAQLACPVYGYPDARLPVVTRALRDRERIAPAIAGIEVIHTPGHTATSVCYRVVSSPAIVFTGDTLFTGGCGRLCEATPATMYASLCTLAALPTTTQLYCGHRYGAENCRFALSLEPHNTNLHLRLQHLRRTGGRDVPSSLAHELCCNPFLRCAETSLKEALGMPDADPVEIFSLLRKRKDRFR